VNGKVYLVGAGPGDPELLTVRALRLLQTADVVLHDDLVPDAIVALASKRALVTSVGKRCGRPRITQAGIHALMIDSSRRGLMVVRLKSGDPMVFGRAAEELNALREAAIEVEVVPGVSAMFAAAAAMQVPMTDRRTASKLILIAGQHASDKSAPPPLWSGTLPEDATLAIYMPGRDFIALARELRSAGVAENTPVVAISKAATPDQRVDAVRMADLEEMVAGAAPLLVLVGRAMECVLLGDDAPMLSIVAEAEGLRG
jgi:uroporphyrin-III C-methyltransferase